MTWAGLAHFAIVFAAGFAVGALRVLYLMPRLNESTAVLIERPIILALSWIACWRLIVRFDVPAVSDARLLMGGVAFATVMGAQLGVSVLGFGRTVLSHLEHYLHASGLLGLAGQIAFAFFPMVQSRMVQGRALE